MLNLPSVASVAVRVWTVDEANDAQGGGEVDRVQAEVDALADEGIVLRDIDQGDADQRPT